MSQQIPVGTVLGGRYEVTSQIIVTAETDMILDGIDQILNRQVSIVVASEARSGLLENNSRVLNENNPYGFQITDMGISPDGSKYLITSHAQPSVLLDALLTARRSLSDIYDRQDTSLKNELFGSESHPATGIIGAEAHPTTGVLGAIKNWDDNPTQLGYTGPGMYTNSDFDDDEEDEYEDDGRRGTWAIALAAVLLLVIVAGGVIISLTNIGSSANNAEHKSPKSSSASATGGESPGDNASASASPSTSGGAPKIATVTRLIPNNPTYMADMDGKLPALTDNNPSTVWTSYGLPQPTTSFGLSLKLQNPGTVSKLTLQQNTGTGGAFTVYVSSQNSLTGATQVGQGTFNGQDVVVDLDTSAQSPEKGAYVIIQFTQVPKLTQPIIAGNPYGVRLSEIKLD